MFQLKHWQGTITTLVSLMIMGSVTAFAISDDQLVIGGIPLYGSPEYVMQVYGKPQKIGPVQGFDETRYSYGSFWVGVDDYTHKITSIFTTANNGIATSKGITVGTKYQRVLDLYGTPDKTDSRHYASYRANGGWLVFELKNGIVTTIKCFDRDV